jgi:hypothetical protein
VAGPAPIRPLPALTAPAAPPRHLPDFPPDGVLNEERSKTVALCRIYVDEVGNHDLTHTDDPNQRFLSLTGVILESSYTLRVLQPEMDQIKRELFQDDPDEPVIFHRKEMVNKRPPFHLLRDVDLEHRFNSALLDALARWDYKVITVVLDKRAYQEHYQVWRYHPYHYALTALLEIFVSFLRFNNHRGDVLVEARGSREDNRLKESYARLYQQGTDHVPAERWQERLTSGELKVKPKSANIVGLQLADLVAHPSRREVLIEHQLLVDDRNVFGDRICAILRQSKYHRSWRTGQIEEYGKKLLP